MKLIYALAITTLFLSGSHTALAQQEIVPPPDEETTEPILPPENNTVLETEQTLERLFDQLKKDPKESSASATARMIWREWSTSGSKSIDLLMSWAASAMKKQEFAKAEDLLAQVIVLKPKYAEGWNRRATLYFSKQDYSRSLADIEQTLSLEPRHFGALSGLAVIMQRLDRTQDALKAWYRVLEIYPANQQAQSAVITLEEELAGSRT
jgi:tetratricopeptide (TPR) repeat protein